MATTFHSEGAKLVRRNRWWLALGASPYLAAPLLLLAAVITGRWPFAIPVFHSLLFGTLALSWSYRRNKDPVLVPGGISVDETAVYHAGLVVARREELTGAFLTPKGGEHVVRLVRRGLRPSVLVSVRDAEEGRALLRALGFDATQTAAEVRAASGVFAWSLKKQMLVMLAPVIAVVFGFQALAVALGIAPVAAITPLIVLTWIFSLVLSSTRVRIGVDGVHTRWLGKERFIAFSQVRGVDSYEERVGGKTYVGVSLLLQGGERVRIPTGQKGWGGDPREMEERIREAHELHRRGDGNVDPRLFARAGRDLGGWVAALRGLGSGANADMRTPPVPEDRLLGIAEDATSPPLVRAGAAVAAAGLSPEARKRVRLAAETTASPALRVALERVSADDVDEEALAEALGELDEAEADARG